MGVAPRATGAMRTTLIILLGLSLAAPLRAGEALAAASTSCYIVGDRLPAELPPGDLPAAYRQFDAHMKPIEGEIEALSKEIDDLYDQEAAAAGREDDAASNRLLAEIEGKERKLQAKREASFTALNNAVSTLLGPTERKVLEPALRFALRNDCKSVHLVRAANTRELVKEGAWDMTEAFAASYGLSTSPESPSGS